jgi:hypothetical protein
MRGKGPRPDEAILEVCEWVLVYRDLTVAEVAERVWGWYKKRKKGKRFRVEDIGMLIAKMSDEEYFGEYHDGAARDFLEFMRMFGMMDFGNEPITRKEKDL